MSPLASRQRSSHRPLEAPAPPAMALFAAVLTALGPVAACQEEPTTLIATVGWNSTAYDVDQLAFGLTDLDGDLSSVLEDPETPRVVDDPWSIEVWFDDALDGHRIQVDVDGRSAGRVVGSGAGEARLVGGSWVVVLLDLDEPLCGDGEVRAPLEDCDDGNSLPGDGCGSLCQLEGGDGDGGDAPDGGGLDAGHLDAGHLDAGDTDAGDTDAGDGPGLLDGGAVDGGTPPSPLVVSGTAEVILGQPAILSVDAPGLDVVESYAWSWETVQDQIDIEGAGEPTISLGASPAFMQPDDVGDRVYSLVVEVSGTEAGMPIVLAALVEVTLLDPRGPYVDPESPWGADDDGAGEWCGHIRRPCMFFDDGYQNVRELIDRGVSAPSAVFLAESEDKYTMGGATTFDGVGLSCGWSDAFTERSGRSTVVVFEVSGFRFTGDLRTVRIEGCDLEVSSEQVETVLHLDEASVIVTDVHIDAVPSLTTGPMVRTSLLVTGGTVTLEDSIVEAAPAILESRGLWARSGIADVMLVVDNLTLTGSPVAASIAFAAHFERAAIVTGSTFQPGGGEYVAGLYASDSAVVTVDTSTFLAGPPALTAAAAVSVYGPADVEVHQSTATASDAASTSVGAFVSQYGNLLITESEVRGGGSPSGRSTAAGADLGHLVVRESTLTAGVGSLGCFGVAASERATVDVTTSSLSTEPGCGGAAVGLEVYGGCGAGRCRVAQSFLLPGTANVESVAVRIDNAQLEIFDGGVDVVSSVLRPSAGSSAVGVRVLGPWADRVLVLGNTVRLPSGTGSTGYFAEIDGLGSAEAGVVAGNLIRLEASASPHFGVVESCGSMLTARPLAVVENMIGLHDPSANATSILLAQGGGRGPCIFGARAPDDVLLPPSYQGNESLLTSFQPDGYHLGDVSQAMTQVDAGQWVNAYTTRWSTTFVDIDGEPRGGMWTAGADEP